MNRTISILVAAGLIAAGLAAGYWWGANKSAPAGAAPAAAKSERKILYYRNPMAPEVTSPVPKKAPDGMDYVPVYAEDDGAGPAAKPAGKILYYRNPMGLPDTSPVPKKDAMGMDYVPVYDGEGPDRSMPPGTVKISLDKVQILGVRTESIERRELRRSVHAVGTIQANERLLYKVAPRFEGWIEKLYVNTTGQSVARGQPLMEVYSPDLVTAQEEYLIALRGARELKDVGPDSQAVMQRLADDVLRRLRNWEISDKEIQVLQQEGKPRRLLAYRSSANGVVIQKPSVQGMRFMPGEVLFEIADLSSVWMLADVSEQDVGLVHLGQEAKLRIVAYPDRSFAGKVVFLYPTIDSETRTAKVRIELANPGALLKPAMFANVELVSGHGRGKLLAVPESAVLDSGERQIVLVRRGEGLFEPRTVKLGMRADGYMEVTEGLKAGEQVVVRANFLIDAESNLKAAVGAFGHGGHAGAAKPAAGKADAAETGMPTYKASGTVEAVNPGAGSVEIKHGAIAGLNWPAMTMEFKVGDKSLLDGVKPGQAVEFELMQHAPGEFTIERIAPAGRAEHEGH